MIGGSSKEQYQPPFFNTFFADVQTSVWLCSDSELLGQEESLQQVVQPEPLDKALREQMLGRLCVEKIKAKRQLLLCRRRDFFVSAHLPTCKSVVYWSCKKVDSQMGFQVGQAEWDWLLNFQTMALKSWRFLSKCSVRTDHCDVVQWL